MARVIQDAVLESLGASMVKQTDAEIVLQMPSGQRYRFAHVPGKTFADINALDVDAIERDGRLYVYAGREAP